MKFLNKNKAFLLLFLILLVAGTLRFYKINEVPVSLYWDEVASTYNAYAIAQTGKDEFGRTLPFLFRSFEDYKTPANIYLTAIAVKMFGLNEFSARFTSGFFGTLTVFLTFFLARELTRKLKESESISLLSAFLMAISPWHIQFSRTGFEANVGLFFVVLGIFLFFKFINEKKYLIFYLSMAVFALSLYFYRSIWIFIPAFLLFLFVIYRGELFSKESFKKTVLGFLLFVFILLPFMPVMVSKEGLTRARQVNVVSNSQEEVYESAIKQNEDQSLVSKTVNNRRLVYVKVSVLNYLSHFSPVFLFLNGDGNGRHGARDTGAMYLWEAPFLLLGIISLLKFDKKIKYSLLAWAFLAPIPAALSVPSPHSLRSLNALPLPEFIASLGIVYAFLRASKRWRKVLTILLSVIIVLFVFRYLNSYYGETARKTSGEWADGYKQLALYVFENEESYDKIVISGHYWQPYIYVLFYKNYDPSKFQDGGSKRAFDKYIFGGTSWDMDGNELGELNIKALAGSNNVLVALSPQEYNFQKENIEILDEIRNHNNELVFIVGKLK